MALKKINLQVKKGEFICIIGDVASGKSSLLSAIIGDLLHVPIGSMLDLESCFMTSETTTEIKNY
jgi:ABC-type phosphate/phosphonate transport system ATPase subunit